MLQCAVPKAMAFNELIIGRGARLLEDRLLGGGLLMHSGEYEPPIVRVFTGKASPIQYGISSISNRNDIWNEAIVI